MSKSSQPLVERLRERIGREGPLTFAEWMRAALYDEDEGYYCRRDRRALWGRAADYRTSPERTRLFPATFAAYFAGLFEELGSPQTLTISEGGAGAGHFARGLLDTLRETHPELYRAVVYVIDERSPASRAESLSLLADHHDRVRVATPGETFRSDPGIIFSNELLDAFPVHRVCLRGGELRELRVATDEGGAFVWVEAEPSTERLTRYLDRQGITLRAGQVAEINLEAEDWMRETAAALVRGYVVTVDYGALAPDLYGAPHRGEGTLRAISQHRHQPDPLARPGECDLTTHVNWTGIIAAGEEAGLRTILFERQDRFLLEAGLLAQLERLSAHATDEAEVARLRLEAREMIIPGGMGASFQVLVQRK